MDRQRGDVHEYTANNNSICPKRTVCRIDATETLKGCTRNLWLNDDEDEGGKNMNEQELIGHQLKRLGQGHQIRLQQGVESELWKERW